MIIFPTINRSTPQPVELFDVIGKCTSGAGKAVGAPAIAGHVNSPCGTSLLSEAMLNIFLAVFAFAVTTGFQLVAGTDTCHVEAV